MAPQPPNRSTYPLRLSGNMWLLNLSAAPLIHSSTLTTCGSSWLLGLQTTLLIHSGYLATCGSLASEPPYSSTQALWPHVAPQPLCCCSTYPLSLSDPMWLLGLQTALLIHSGSLATCGSSASEPLYSSTKALWPCTCGSSAFLLLLHLSTGAL